MTLVDLVGKLAAKAQERRSKPGLLGKPTGPGTYQFEPDDNDHPGFVLVRIERGSNSSIIEGLNCGVQLIGDLPVKVITAADGTEEVYPDGMRTTQWLGTQAGALGPAIPHSHEIGAGLDDPVSARRIKPGLVYVTTPASLSVNIAPFFYRYGGSEKYFPGSVFDLTGNKPVTANAWAWVKVGIDPSVNMPVAITGAEYSVLTPLNEEFLDDVDFAGYIPLAGVRLKTSDTSINVEKRFADCRLFFGGSGDPGLAHMVVDSVGNVVTSDGEVVWAI